MSSNKIVGTPDLIKTFNWSPTNPQYAEPISDLYENGYVGGDKPLASNVNFLYKEFGEKINHILQNGVPKWISTKAYLIGDVVNHSGRVYQVLVGNTNSEPTTTNTNWTYLGNKADLQTIIDSVTTANGNIATNTSAIASLNAVKNPTVTGNALKIPRVNSGATAYESVSFDSLLPTQSGLDGAFLKTDGSSIGWGFVPFAWVNFDGTTGANLTGTYTRAGTLVTASVIGHGHLVDHWVYVDFTTGGALDGWYKVASVVDSDTFTFNTVATGTITTSNLTLSRRSIRNSLNVANVAYDPGGAGGYGGEGRINLLTPANNSNYALVGTASSRNAFTYPSMSFHWSQNRGLSVPPTTTSFAYTTTIQAGAFFDFTDNSIAIFA